MRGEPRDGKTPVVNAAAKPPPSLWIALPAAASFLVGRMAAAMLPVPSSGEGAPGGLTRAAFAAACGAALFLAAARLARWDFLHRPALWRPSEGLRFDLAAGLLLGAALALADGVMQAGLEAARLPPWTWQQSLAGADPGSPPAGGASGTSPLATSLALGLLAAVVAPVLEELLFRGFLIEALLPRAGPAAAVVASSILFAAFHGEALLPLTAKGLVLGWIFLRTRSLFVPILAHATNNAAALALLALSSGGP